MRSGSDPASHQPSRSVSGVPVVDAEQLGVLGGGSCSTSTTTLSMACASSGGMVSSASPTASSNSASDRCCMGRVCHAGPGMGGHAWARGAAREGTGSPSAARDGRWRGPRIRREGPPDVREVPLVCVSRSRCSTSVALLVRLDRLAFAAGPCLLDGLVPTVDGGAVVVVLVVGRLELGRGRRSHAVTEVEVRELRAQSLLAGDRAVDAVGVLARRELKRLVGLVLDQGPALVGRERRVDLLEPTVGVAPDGARLAAVQDLLAVGALQAEADALGDPERRPAGRRRTAPAGSG